MRRGSALLARGIRWRLGMSLLTVLTSAIAVGAAVLGPLYLTAAGDSVVRSTVSGAAVSDRGVTLLSTPGHTISQVKLGAAERAVEDLGGHRRWFGAAISSVISGVELTGPGRSPLGSQLFSRTGICRVLRFVRGSCELGPGDVALSARSAGELRDSVGARFDVRASFKGRPLLVRVTGIYAVPNLDLPYWWGQGPSDFAFGTLGAVAGVKIPELDPLISSPATAAALPEAPERLGQVPLRAGQVGLDDEDSLLHSLARASGSRRTRGVVLSTRLPRLLSGASRQRHQMSTIVVVAAVELVVLAIWMLASLLLRSGEARLPEMRVAQLRGFPPAALLAATAAEPALLCSLGAVLGILAAWIVLVIARDAVLDPVATISLDGWTYISLGVALASIIVTLAAGSLRLIRHAGLSAGSAARSRRGGLETAGDAVVLVLSIVALTALSNSGALSSHQDPIASAAPGLIALGVAVIAVHAVLLTSRLMVALSAGSSHVGTFLAVRQIARRPALVRQARVLIITVALACFATSAWSVARSNRSSDASFSVGASTVAMVNSAHGTNLEAAVARADPRGRFAMAVVSINTPSSTVLAVDAHRLGAVASWPPGVSPKTIAEASRAIDPSSAPQINLSGSTVTATLQVAVAGRLAARLANLRLGLWLFNGELGTSIVELGPLRAGTRSYAASLSGSCPGGCRLAGLGVLPSPGKAIAGSGSVTLLIHRLAVRTPSSGLTRIRADLASREWTASAEGASVHAAPSGLRVEVPAGALYAYTSAALSSAPPMITPADRPSRLPSVATEEIESLDGSSVGGNPIPIQGLDGNTLNVVPRITSLALPRVGGDAVMVDLDLLQSFQTDPTSRDATDEVWLGPHAPADALARLRNAGLRIDGLQRASTILRQLQRSGPALADDFLLLATIVALIAAALSTLSTLGAAVRQRATELTALEVTGVRRAAIFRALSLEVSALAMIAVFGAGAGILAAALAVPALPELAGSPLFHLSYQLPAGLLAAVTAIAGVIVLLAGTAVTLALMRRMSPRLLQIAPDESTG